MVKRLLRDNLLVKVIPEEEVRLTSGLILPTTRVESRYRCKVIDVGPGYKDCPVTTNIGDIVHIDKELVEMEVVQQWFVDGEDGEKEMYLIARESDVTAIL